MLNRFFGSLLFAVGCLAACAASSSYADGVIKRPEGPVSLKNGLSPDGRKEIVFVWRTEPVEGWGTCYLQDLLANKLENPLAWKGFGQPYEVLWRPDGGAFAIKGEAARGYVVCKVYLRQGSGRYHLVKTPDLVRSVAAKYHLETYGKGGEHPAKWLPSNRLAVDVYDRSWAIKDAGDATQPYRVILQLPRGRSSPHKASIEDISPVSLP